MKKIIISLVVIFNSLFLIQHSIAQWEADVRLTNNSADSYLSYNNAWCIAASGSVVHLVWRDDRDGNPEIYYKRSTNGGVSWGSDTRLTNNTSSSFYPSIAVTGSIVHVVWQDYRDGNYEIYYKRSIDGGTSWNSDIRLTNNSAGSWNPSLASSGSILHLVWSESRDGNTEIYYKRSIDAGINWGNDTRLTNNNANSDFPSVAVSGTVVNVVWQDWRDGNPEIYNKRSVDDGLNWGSDTRLTNNSAISYRPSISTAGLIVHVVWADTRDGNYEIYYKRSIDGGINWGSDTRLTNNSAVSDYPNITASYLAIHLVWRDDRDGNNEIYYKRSTDGGINWEVDTRLTNQFQSSSDPFVTTFGTIVHVVWVDGRDGNNEIYYKRNPTGNPIGIHTISTRIPEEFELYQNYPNPFNPITNIEFDIPKSSYVTLGVYDITGREVASLVNENLFAGSYRVNFDGCNLTSGVYYYRLITADYAKTNKMILVK